MIRISALFMLAIAMAAFALTTGGAAGCGQNIPNVEGTYDLATTECPGVFSETVDITQNGDVITFEPLGLSGSIDGEGGFNVSNGDITCFGDFIDTTATATCTGEPFDTCDIVYEKR